MKNIFSLIAIFAIVGMAFVGCQKDAGVEPEKSEPETMDRRLKIEPVTPINAKKDSVVDYLPTFYTDDDWNPLKSKVYKTVIIGNQEWFAEPWNSECADEMPFSQYKSFRCPSDGNIYYEWDLLGGTTQEVWNKYIFKDKPGFHIPTHEEFKELYKNLHYSKRNLKKYLHLEVATQKCDNNGVFSNIDSDFSEYMWLDGEYNPNGVDGCGMILDIPKPIRSHSNIKATGQKHLAHRVWLVRNVVDDITFKYSSVTDYLPQNYNSEVEVYKTIIIGNQEWILGTWNNKYIDNLLNGEDGAYEAPDGSMYYEWESVIEKISQSTWNDSIFKDKPGFHIPTMKEVHELYDNVHKSIDNLKNILRLERETYVWYGDPSYEFNLYPADFDCYFWINEQNSPNRVDGCGVALWSLKQKIGPYFTNINKLGDRVALVRNIK